MSNAPFPHRLVPRGRQIRHDAQLGHAFVANIHRRVPHEHGAYFSVTNTQGFRENHDLDAPPPGVHVMCYGDSYTAGDGVNNEQRFSALLAERLGIAVSNVAVPGHGPDQNVLQLESGAQPQPDLLLFCIAVHTIERIQSGKRITIDREDRLWHVDRPHFVLTPTGSLELRGVPVAEEGVELVEPPMPQIQAPAKARLLAVKARFRSALVRVVGPLIKAPPDPGYETSGKHGAQWSLLKAIVQRFHAAAGDVPVAIVPLPTARYIKESHEPHFQKRFAELHAPSRGLHVLDVTTHMRARPRALRAGCHYRFDGHFTASGHELVADALVEQLREHNLVANPSDSAPGKPAELGRPIERRQDVELHVEWQLGDASARLLASGTVLAEHRESHCTGHSCRPGVLPLSAIHACLEDLRIAGPELRAIELHAPCSVEDLARIGPKDPRWLALASGWVRWRGAAEVDLRKFVCFTGAIGWHSSAKPPTDQAEIASVPGDDEQRWLHSHLDKLGERLDARALQKLAVLWELATREARESVLPTTAPLRRGRMAAQLAQTASKTSG